MVAVALSYDQAPPFGLPFRFFLVSPLFLVLAAATALAVGPDLYLSRWAPATLAVTHLLTLGFLAMTMVGALLQMLPVVLGVRIRAVHAVSWVGLIGIGTGTLMLAAGLAFTNPNWLIPAAGLLTLGLAPFLVAMLLGVADRGLTSVLAWPMRQAWLSLLVVSGLGLWLALVLAGRIGVADIVVLADVHLAWGLGGWVLILVTGVAYQVVPMLQLTPNYPALLMRWLSGFMLLSVMAYGAARLMPQAPSWLAIAAKLTGAGSALVFALATLWLQKRRRRKIGDATLSFWRFGMTSLAVFALALPFVNEEKLQIALAVLFLLGFAASVVMGMLYKIVPFLAWFHLQAQKPGQAATIPNMKQFVQERMAQRQLWLHASGVLLCLSAPWLPDAVGRIGAAAMMASGGLLWLNLLRARRVFLQNGGRL